MCFRDAEMRGAKNDCRLLHWRKGRPKGRPPFVRLAGGAHFSERAF
jgi:hypothetical protein